jgi:thiol-disulfide isomerase/thioredoxin
MNLYNNKILRYLWLYLTIGLGILNCKNGDLTSPVAIAPTTSIDNQLYLDIEGDVAVSILDDFENITLFKNGKHTIRFDGQFKEVIINEAGYIFGNEDSIVIRGKGTISQKGLEIKAKKTEASLSIRSVNEFLTKHRERMWVWTHKFSKSSDEYVKNTNRRNVEFNNDLEVALKPLKSLEKQQISSHFYKIQSAYFKYRLMECNLSGIAFQFDKFPLAYQDSLARSMLYEIKKDTFFELKSFRSCLKHLVFYYTIAEKLPSHKVIDKYFSGKQKEYLLASFIYPTNFKNKDKEDIRQLKKMFDSLAVDSTYIDYVRSGNSVHEISLNDQELISYDGKKVRFGQFGAAKFYYIDYWATWCFPCREELPLSLELAKKFNTQEIDFIYISFDSNSAAWKKYIEKNKLPKDKCYILPKGKDSQLAIKYKIKTIPRYMLLKQMGKVIDPDALRPSDEELEAKLMNLK